MVTLSPELTPSLQLQVKSVDSTVEAGAQFQQMVNIECVADFTQQPDLNVVFTCNGRPYKLPLKIPISINKFMEPTEMNGDAFFARWKNLSMYVMFLQKIITCGHEYLLLLQCPFSMTFRVTRFGLHLAKFAGFFGRNLATFA